MFQCTRWSGMERNLTIQEGHSLNCMLEWKGKVDQKQLKQNYFTQELQTLLSWMITCSISLHSKLLQIIFHKKDSISISTAEAGMFRSKAVSTSGCSTPSLPTTEPLTWTSAQRPGKNVESVLHVLRVSEWVSEWEREREREREREGEGKREKGREGEGERARAIVRQWERKHLNHSTNICTHHR